MLRNQLADRAGEDLMESVLDRARSSTGDEGSRESSVGVGVLQQRQAEAEHALPAPSRWLSEPLAERAAG